MKRKKILLVSIILAVSVVTLALLLWAQISVGREVATLISDLQPTLPPLETRFDSLLIQLQDLPPGWRSGGKYREEVPGAEARLYYFYGSPNRSQNWVRVTQKLILYPTSKAAEDAYAGWVDRRIPPDYAHTWLLPPELESEYQADQMTVACLPAQVNGYSHHTCLAIGLYGETIVVLSGNVFVERWLTMKDFRAVLNALDQRMVTRSTGEP